MYYRRRCQPVEFKINSDGGAVLCNPPYGERLLDLRAAEEIIRLMGRVFKPHPKWSYYIISPHDDFKSFRKTCG